MNRKRPVWQSVLPLVGLCIALVACDVLIIRGCTPTAAPRNAFLAGLVNFGFYLLGVSMAPVFVAKTFARWWRKIDWWQVFLAPIFFGIACAARNALHAQPTGLTAIGLAYGVGFVSNPEVFNRFKDVLKFLVSLRGR